MKQSSYCDAPKDDEEASVGTLRLGIVLVVLPVLAFAIGYIYLSMVPHDTIHAPEELGWRVLMVELICVCLSAVCLMLSFGLLSPHFRRRRSAKWGVVCAAIETLLIIAIVVYDIAA